MSLTQHSLPEMSSRQTRDTDSTSLEQDDLFSTVEANETLSPATQASMNNRRPRRQLSTRIRQTIKVQFTDVAAHTAKCDECDGRNKDGMTRCHACGWQCCRKCLGERPAGRIHNSSTSVHTPEDESLLQPVTNRASVFVPADGPANRPATRSPEDNQAARALLDISSDATGPRKRRKVSTSGVRSEGSGLAHGAEMDQSVNREGTVLMRSRGETNISGPNGGEEFGNVRRNPSRKARPIDLMEN